MVLIGIVDSCVEFVQFVRALLALKISTRLTGKGQMQRLRTEGTGQIDCHPEIAVVGVNGEAGNDALLCLGWSR
jgi:hypothetical protein